MTSQGVPLENDLLSIPIRKSVVIQIQELPLTSPTQETVSTSCHGIVEILGKMEEGSIDTSRVWIEGLKLERPQTSDGQRSLRRAQSKRRRRSSVGSMGCRAGDPHSHGLHRRPILRLPSFENSSIPACLVEQSEPYQRSTNVAKSGRVDVVDQSRSISGAHQESFGLFPTQSWPLTSHMDTSSFHYPSGIQPLLTPPEDIDSFKWDTAVQPESTGEVRTVPINEPGRARGGQTQEQPRSSPTTRPSEIQMPAPSNMSSDESNMSNWLGRACQHLGMILQKRSFKSLFTNEVSSFGFG
jgi:hypothetical protein